MKKKELYVKNDEIFGKGGEKRAEPRKKLPEWDKKQTVPENVIGTKAIYPFGRITLF
jgi:hypothetical protein